MNDIIGSNGSMSAFLSFINPFLQLCYRIISVELMGMPVWAILLNMLVCFTVIGFIVKGSVGIGAFGSVKAGSDAKKAQQAKQSYYKNRQRNGNNVRNRSV